MQTISPVALYATLRTPPRTQLDRPYCHDTSMEQEYHLFEGLSGIDEISDNKP